MSAPHPCANRQAYIRRRCGSRVVDRFSIGQKARRNDSFAWYEVFDETTQTAQRQVLLTKCCTLFVTLASRQFRTVLWITIWMTKTAISTCWLQCDALFAVIRLQRQNTDSTSNAPQDAAIRLQACTVRSVSLIWCGKQARLGDINDSRQTRHNSPHSQSEVLVTIEKCTPHLVVGLISC